MDQIGSIFGNSDIEVFRSRGGHFKPAQGGGGIVSAVIPNPVDISESRSPVGLIVYDAD